MAETPQDDKPSAKLDPDVKHAMLVDLELTTLRIMMMSTIAVVAGKSGAPDQARAVVESIKDFSMQAVDLVWVDNEKYKEDTFRKLIAGQIQTYLSAFNFKSADEK